MFLDVERLSNFWGSFVTAVDIKCTPLLLAGEFVRDDTAKKNYVPWKKNSRSLEKIFTAPGKEFLLPWPCGPLVVWSFGPLVLWLFGPLVLWSSGPVVLWSCGPLVLWFSGPVFV